MQQTFLFAICLAVIIPVTWTIQKSVPKSECRQMMDMVVVVDGSDSILEKDYTKQRHAIKDMIEGMEVGENASRVGLVVFSTGIAQLVNLTGSLKVLRNKSLELEHPRDGTETHVGINAMMQMFKDHGREKVPWVCLVITDGLSKKPRLTKKASRKAKERGINIFAVGISHEIMQEELQNIASSPDQVLMLQTFDQLQVSLMSLMKVVCPCPDPPMVPHGIVDKGTRSIGSNRTYICEEGYQPIGMPRIRCKKDSTWTTLEFSCNACPDPLPVYRNGYVTEGLNLLLSTRQYICLKGYTAPEPLIAVCEAGPKGPFWKMPEKGCLACHKPPRFRDGYLDMKIVDTLVGTTRFYHCDEGFIATGPIETTCIDDKGIPTWTKPSHRCIACKKPPKLDYAVVDTTGGNRIGMKRIYKCIPGYHPTGPIEALCLGEKGAAFWKTSEHFCTACKEPPTVPNAVLHKDGDSLVGSIRTYICLKGFQPTGPIEVECKTSPGVAYWDGPKHKCVACIPPPVLPHAILDPLGDTLVGSIRNYNCMKGYIPNGPIEVGCIKGTGGPLWTSAEYHCIACPTPPPVQHALMDPAGDDLVGSKRLYHCMKGYIPSIAGPIIRECIGEYDVAKRRGKAFWSDPSHYCKACPDPPPIEFGKVEHGDSLIGSTRSYICLKGFYATGPIRIRCEKDGTWTKPKHSCTACGPVPFVDHADVDDGSHQLGTIRYYKCHQGYTHTNTPTIVCLKDAKWSAVNFSCVACEKPYGLKNAVLEPGENLIGIVRRYTCLPGYLATGPITSTCAVPPKMMKPDWSTPVHYCKDCGDPYPVDNAIPMKGQRTIGAVQQYVCKKGYVPSAPPLSHCMPNAEWTPPEFTCVVCKAPPKLNNAQVDKVGDTMVGTIRTYTCNTGYLATGPMEVICEAKQKDGYPLPYWKTLLDNYCKDCGTPPNITRAVWLNGAKTIGSIAQYVCETGYVPSGPPEIVCGRDATWANPAFTCTGCEITPDVQYAIPVAGVKALYTTGSVIVYECISGYVAIGTPKLVCQNDATWSPKQFHCKLTCGEPDIYIDAVVDTGGNLLDDVRYYICNKGLKTVGDASVTCLKSGKWSARQFECAKCLPAPMLPYAIRMSDDTMIGSEVPYQCEDGYISDGPVISTCLMDLTWSPSKHSCYGCSTTPVVDNTLPITTETPMYKIGTILTYQCLAGYVATATPELRCQKDGTWSKQQFQCILSCGEPDIYIDADVDTGGNLLNDIRYYTCKKGLKTVGDASVTCLESGKWSARKFECAKCLPAPDLPYAMRMSDDTMIGSEVPYQCEDGYISDGPVISTCLMDLSWSPSLHSCYGCSTTPVVDNTLPITTKAPMYKIGIILTYQCLAGYVATAAPELLCQKDGTWSKQKFQCILSCGEPDIYIDADVDTGGNLLHDIRYYTCKKGLKTVGDASVTCLESGKWSARKFECAKCLPAPDLPYAIRMSDDTMIGSEVPYQCEDGYISDGPVISTCLMNLTWSPSLHSCYGCSTTPVVDNTLPITTKAPMYKIGIILTYQCLAGYVATAAPELLCQKDGTWSKQKFQCILSCGEPDIYIDADVDTGGNLLHDIRYYTCKKGLKTVGDASVTCLESGKWSARKFECAKCLPAPDLPYAIRMSDDTMIGSKVPYQCEDGYISDGPVMSTCLMDLTWSPSKHSCYGCSMTPVIDNTLPISTKVQMYKIGTLLTYQCLAGYVATAAPELRCQKDGTWSIQEFQCILSCGEPDIYIDAVVDVGGNLLNDTRYYTCNKGLKTVGDASVTCLKSGKWSARQFECAKCLPAPMLPYAIRMSDDTMIGSEVPYQCEDGYISDGPVISTCLMDLTWSPSLHTCYGCSTTPVIDHTLPITTKSPMYKIGTILTYQCLAGYVATAAPELRCKKDGTWSKQKFQCILSCGEPPNYTEAILETGGTLLGDVRRYKCVQGLKTEGEPTITCLPSGIWSKRFFNCTKCLPAPILDYAVPLPGESFIGSEVVYECKEGLKSDGPVVSMCQKNLSWSTPVNKCYDCGVPPTVPHAYLTLGKTTIGSIRRYTCEANYDMSGSNDTIVCLPDAKWSVPQFSCYVRTTTTTTTPAPVKGDPSVCDRCRMLNGVGFIGHPSDCTKYVQCYYSRRGVEAVYQPCPFGQYWDQADLTCKPAEAVDCPAERCLNPKLDSYKHTDSEKCCAYWVCINGKSVAKCCGKGYRFVDERGCVEDPTCNALCPWEDEVPVCDKRPLHDITRFEQHVGNGYWVKMSCGPGTGFNIVDCACTLDTVVVPGFACKPEILLDFNHNVINDASGRNVHIYNEGVYPYKGAAYFNGRSRLIINRFSNTEFRGHLVVKLRYKEQLRGPTGNMLQALITNGDCGDDPSIIVAKMPGYVLLGAKTDRPKSFALPTLPKDWKEVIYIHDEQRLEGKVCGASYSKWSWGPIRSTHCGIQIGHGTNLFNYTGLIDDITLYQCRPQDSVLTVYGGRTRKTNNRRPPTLNVH